MKSLSAAVRRTGAAIRHTFIPSLTLPVAMGPCLALLVIVALAAQVGCNRQGAKSTADKSPPAGDSEKSREKRPATPRGGGPTDPTQLDPAPDTTSNPSAGQEPVDVSFVSEDFVAALVLHPSRTLDSQVARPLLEDKFVQSQWFDSSEKQLGFDVRDLEEVVVLLGTPMPIFDAADADDPREVGTPEAVGEPVSDEPTGEPAEPAADEDGDVAGADAPMPRNGDGEVNLDDLFFDLPAAEEANEDPFSYLNEDPNPSAVYDPVPHTLAGILRFASAESAEGFIAEFKQKMIPAIHKGKTYHRPADDPDFSKVNDESLFGALAVHFPDERTVVLSSEATLMKMLTVGTVESALVKQLGSTGKEFDLLCVVDAASLREDKGLVALLDGLPIADFVDVSPVMSRLQSISVSVDVREEPLIDLTVVATDEDAATEVKTLLEAGIAAAEEGLDRAVSQATEVAPKQAFFDLLTAITTSASVQQDGRVLRAEVPTPATVANLANSLRPAVEMAKESLGQEYRESQLKEIAFAIDGYRLEHERYPAAAVYDADGNALLSWRVRILEYLDEGLYNEFHLDEAWDSPHNLTLIDRMPAVYGDYGSETRVRAFTGENTPFPDGKALTVADIVDGRTKTIFCIRVGSGKSVPWTKPDQLVLDLNDLATSFGDVSSGGFEAIFFDYSIRRIPKSIDPDHLRRLVDPGDGEPAKLDFDQH